MCGIFGFMVTDKMRGDIQGRVNILNIMCRVLKRRGPDEEGFYNDDLVSLGHTRLSVIDLNTGRQPIHNEDNRIWLVFNGEIYNFPELRDGLIKKGHKFYTKSDAEVVLHLYEEEGVDCVKGLDGMFAFAIWDRNQRRLFLARDPIGKKPLHWLADGNKVIFASEIKAILNYPGIQKEIDKESLAKYFLFGFVPAPKTIFRGINKLLPASYLVINEDRTIKEKSYWEVVYSKKLDNCKKDEIKSELVERLSLAVKKRLISDVPLGVFLSGGVDSSLVTALMTKHIEPSQIHAFSIGFNEKSFNESEYAQIVAKYLKVNHHLKIFSQNEVLNLIPKIADFLDEPMADPSIFPTYLLSTFTREYVKVALSGDGGDENFAGYPKYLAHLFLMKSFFEKLPLSLFGKFLKGKKGAFLRYSPYPLHLRNQLWISHIPVSGIRELINAKVDFFEDLERYHRQFNGKDSLDESLFMDLKTSLPDMYLVKTDRASMAASLEVRSPFLAKDIIEFCAKIPFKMKVEGFRTKALLKEIASEFLPKEVIYRKKMGFGIPLAKWLKHDLKPLLEEMTIADDIKKQGLLEPLAVNKILNNNDPNQIWSLLVFELWHKKWMKS